MAEQYTWDKAKQAGYEVDVIPMTRQTIADGNLLNSSAIETFSGRDKYINDNLVKETASANSVYSTVNSNSAKNWANSALSGFSAFQAKSTKLPAKQLNDTLHLNVNGLSSTYTNNKLTLSMPDYYTDSYFQRSNRTNTQQMYDMITPWGLAEDKSGENQGAIFGGGSTVKMYSEFSAFNTKSLIINADRCPSSGLICSVGNIQINPMEITTAHGININARASKLGALVINNSYSESVKQVAINNSNISCDWTYAWNFAMNNCNVAKGNNVLFTNCTADYCNNVCVYDSKANTNSVMAFSSLCDVYDVNVAFYNSIVTGYAWSFAAYNSTAEYSLEIALYNSSAAKEAGCSIIAYNSNASGKESISLYDSITLKDPSLALYNSSAKYAYNCAFHSSTADAPFVFAAFNSYGGGNDGGNGVQTVAYSSVCDSNGTNLAMYQSTARGGASIAAYRSKSLTGACYTWFDSEVTGSYGGQFAAYNSYVHDANAPSNMCLYNSRSETITNERVNIGGSIYSIFTHSSKVDSTDITAYKQVGCGGTQQTAVYSASPTCCIARYNSTVADVDNIAEYNSHVGCGVKMAHALFDSTISATSAFYNSQNTLTATTTSATIAMFNSTAVDALDEMLLWSNKVKIEPSGYVNKMKFIDLSYFQQTIDWPDVAWQTLHKDYHTFIIG